MATNLPINIPIPAESAIASYSWTDIAEGTGVVSFKGVREAIDATPANDIYFLTEQSVAGSVTGTTIATGSPSATAINFDVAFNTPKIIQGRCIITFAGKANSTGSIQPLITIIHYDGSTETTIVSQKTFESKSGTDSIFEWGISLTIPLTRFKKGEIFRVKFNFNSTTSSLANTFYHDAQATTTGAITTGGRLSVLVPFRLDL
jgi:hypothetical protein